jgi:hypothetical protein
MRCGTNDRVPAALPAARRGIDAVSAKVVELPC